MPASPAKNDVLGLGVPKKGASKNVMKGTPAKKGQKATPAMKAQNAKKGKKDEKSMKEATAVIKGSGKFFYFDFSLCNLIITFQIAYEVKIV